jgi:hypothetical protein
VAKKIRPKAPKRGRTSVQSARSLVGVWEQEANPFDTTTVVYTIALKTEILSVSGVDEANGTVLKISRVKWDGEHLCFSTFYPPTSHKARHVLRLLGKKKARHRVTYSDEEGNYVGEEVWKRRPSTAGRDQKPPTSSTSKRRLGCMLLPL